MVIVGFDPGLATLGFGVIKKENKKKPEVVDYGIISTPKDETLPVRLAMLEKGIKQIIERYKPDEIAVEELFFAKNVKTGINVAHARGVILLTAIKECSRLYEYTPLQIKQASCSSSMTASASIFWIPRGIRTFPRIPTVPSWRRTPPSWSSIKTFLGLKSIPKPDDAADALAVALCHAQTNKLGGLFSI